MKKKENARKVYRIFDKTTKIKFEVTKEAYIKYMREIGTYRKAQQRAGKCDCPKKLFWLCDGCCQGCEFEKEIKSIFDYLPDSNVRIVDTIASHDKDHQDIVTDQELLVKLIDRLGEVMPEALDIGKLRVQGKKDEEIAEILSVKRTTFRSRIDKAKDTLSDEFGDVFPF